MGKRVLLLSLALTLIVFSFTMNAAAAYVSSDLRVTYGSMALHVGERVQFTVTCTGGLQPYTYQWYTQLWPTWKPGMGYHLDPIEPEVAVPGATSNVFDFTPAANGTYSISLGITDANGNYTRAVWLPGIWVYVLPQPTPTPKPQNTNAPAPPTITVTSPIENSKNGKNINLTFILETGGNFTHPYQAFYSTAWWGVEELSYSLDGQANVTIAQKTLGRVSGNATVTDLAEGNHTLVVYGKRWLYYGLYFGEKHDYFSSAQVNFTVEESKPNIESPSNGPDNTGAWQYQLNSAFLLLLAGVVVTPFLAGLALLLLKRRARAALVSS